MAPTVPASPAAHPSPARPGWVYRVAVFATSTFARLWFRCRWEHGDRVPATGPVILAANHQSFIDPALIAGGTRRTLHFLAVASAFRTPLRGWIMRGVRSVPVDPDQGMAGLKAIFERLRAGEAVGLFPEGTRTFDGEFLPPRTGIGLLVVRSEAPVVPVRITGAYEAWSRHHRFPRPRRVRVTYGHPLDFAELRAAARSGPRAERRELYDHIAGELMAAIAAIGTDGDRRYGDGPWAQGRAGTQGDEAAGRS